MRIFLFSCIATVLLSCIGYIFWRQELQYIGPTPLPENYTDIEIGEALDIPELSQFTNKLLFVHFYNSDCTCSRFNSKVFSNMVYKYRSEVNFVALIQSEEDNAVEAFKEKYDLGIPIIKDKQGQLAEKLGVYSTPQAVIIKNSTLFYKGNYNRARFCTTKNTKFADMALKAAVEGKPAPHFPELAFVAYGCQLPSNTEKTSLNFFDL